MLVVFIRTVIIYFLVLIVMRLMGKSEISQFQPFEFVIAIILADLATMPMQNPDVSLVNGIVSIVALLIVHICISLLSIKSKVINGLTSGKPVSLINKGIIDIKKLEEQQITVKELQERLRQCDSPYIDNVYYAILETSGELTVINKTNETELENSDGERGLQRSIVINKEIDEDALKDSGKDLEWLNAKIKLMNKKLEDIILMCIDDLDNIIVFSYNEVNK